MAIGDLTLQEIENDVDESQAKENIVGLRNQAERVVMQLEDIITELDNSPAAKAAQQIRSGIISRLKTAFGV